MKTLLEKIIPASFTDGGRVDPGHDHLRTRKRFPGFTIQKEYSCSQFLGNFELAPTFECFFMKNNQLDGMAAFHHFWRNRLIILAGQFLFDSFRDLEKRIFPQIFWNQNVTCKGCFHQDLSLCRNEPFIVVELKNLERFIEINGLKLVTVSKLAQGTVIRMGNARISSLF